jgi:magnesium-transporting ATPase (P-type)
VRPSIGACGAGRSTGDRSKRKRMSCVAEDAERQKVLYIKGADNIMMPLLTQASASFSSASETSPWNRELNV